MKCVFYIKDQISKMSSKQKEPWGHQGWPWVCQFASSCLEHLLHTVFEGRMYFLNKDKHVTEKHRNAFPLP